LQHRGSPFAQEAEVGRNASNILSADKKSLKNWLKNGQKWVK
jgi:hypothetical protein